MNSAAMVLAAGHDISAFIANLGGRYTLKNVQWVPVLNGTYTFASGGGKHGNGSFRPWFDYVDGYNGYLFAPSLSNIHIFNLGASIKPYENTTLSLQAYYYLKADQDSFAGSNPQRGLRRLGIRQWRYCRGQQQRPGLGNRHNPWL